MLLWDGWPWGWCLSGVLQPAGISCVRQSEPQVSSAGAPAERWWAGCGLLPQQCAGVSRGSCVPSMKGSASGLLRRGFARHRRSQVFLDECHQLPDALV